MKVHTLLLGALGTNSYLLEDEDTHTCAVIDPADEYGVIRSELSRLGLTVAAILLTHVHFDHIGALYELARDTGATVYVGESDRAALSEPTLNLSAAFGNPIVYGGKVTTVRDGSVIPLGNSKITVLETPGHTPGSVCYLTEEGVFCGDTVFREGIGRTDFPGGSTSAILESLDTILALDEERTLYPGHGGVTTVEHEKRYNPHYHTKTV